MVEILIKEKYLPQQKPIIARTKKGISTISFLPFLFSTISPSIQKYMFPCECHIIGLKNLNQYFLVELHLIISVHILFLQILNYKNTLDIDINIDIIYIL